MFDINFTSYLYIFKTIRWCRQIAELGDLCSTKYSRCRSCIHFDNGPLFVPISGRRRPDGILLSELLNDFESKKENCRFEIYIYDQEYFDTFNMYDQKHFI